MIANKKYKFAKSLLDLKKNTFFHKVYYLIIDYPYTYKFRKFIKYAVVGLVGTAVDVSLLYVFTEIFSVFYVFSAIISDVARGFTNYNLHKNIAFKDKTKPFTVKNLINFLKYYFVNITSVLFVFLLMILFVEICGFGFILAKMLSDLVMNVYKYFFHSRIVFGKNKRKLGELPIIRPSR